MSRSSARPVRPTASRASRSSSPPRRPSSSRSLSKVGRKPRPTPRPPRDGGPTAGGSWMAGPPATGALTPVGAEPAVDGVPATKPAAGAGPPGPGWVGAGVFGGTVTTPDPREPAAPMTLGAAEGTGPLHTCNPAPRTTARPHEARKARAPTAVHTVVGTARHRAIGASFRVNRPRTCDRHTSSATLRCTECTRMVTGSGHTWHAGHLGLLPRVPATTSRRRTAPSEGRTLRREMTDWVLWLIAAGLLGIAEMLTLTFVLGMLAVAATAAAVAAGV